VGRDVQHLRSFVDEDDIQGGGVLRIQKVCG